MWLEILKKDLRKQKSVNIILLLFITLSTIFLASSVSNICLVLNGLEKYMEYANVSDVTAVFGGVDEKEVFEGWLDGRGEVTEYAGEQLCEIAADDVSMGEGRKADSLRQTVQVCIWGRSAADMQSRWTATETTLHWKWARWQFHLA